MLFDFVHDVISCSSYLTRFLQFQAQFAIQKKLCHVGMDCNFELQLELSSCRQFQLQLQFQLVLFEVAVIEGELGTHLFTISHTCDACALPRSLPHNCALRHAGFDTSVDRL